MQTSMQEGGLLASALGIITKEGKRREREGKGEEGRGTGGRKQDQAEGEVGLQQGPCESLSQAHGEL